MAVQRLLPGNQLQRADFDLLGRDADGDEFTACAQTVDARRHRLCSTHGCHDSLGAAEGLQLPGDVLLGVVYEVPRAELPGGFLYVAAAGDGHCVEAHLVGELYCQMSKSADPEYADQVTGLSGRAAQAAEHGHTRASHRPGLDET